MGEKREEPFVRDARDLRQRGFRSGAAEYISDHLNLDQRLVKNPFSTFFWQARGDEARIVGIRNGDLLVLDLSEEPQHGDLAVVWMNRGFRIRRLRRWGDQLVPVPLRRFEKLDPFEEIEVWGVILFVVREFRHPRRPRRL